MDALSAVYPITVANCPLLSFPLYCCLWLLYLADKQDQDKGLKEDTIADKFGQDRMTRNMRTVSLIKILQKR